MAEYTSYMNEDLLPLPFCPGCGHSVIVDKLDDALVKLQLDPHKVVIVTDIGCSGLSDKFFKTNAFHGLHGRSVTYATGIKLANPELHVIVLMGDGGCGIGGHHLINAARRNIGATVLVFNNLNYGMTGGQVSVSTPSGAITSSTRYGNLEQPLDICQTVAVNGAGFVARTTASDDGLADLISIAITHDGFALLDIWELCTAHFVPQNRFTQPRLEQTMAELGFARGIIQGNDRVEFSRAYRQAVGPDLQTPHSWIGSGLEVVYEADLQVPMQIVVAGSAGMRVGSAAQILCHAAILSGLYASQRSEYPVTVRTGFSTSELIISPYEIQYAGITKPDILIILSQDGLAQAAHWMESMTESDQVFIDDQLPAVETRAQVRTLALRMVGRKSLRSLAALAAVAQASDLIPIAALEEAIKTRSKQPGPSLKTIEHAPQLID
jgi:pyruvate/2-oxoacid:ferredoxin oxidoreductase beta subunit/Pyruvate/2-oxoacid:ferredoxin oxidoreductase gamma subunit